MTEPVVSYTKDAPYLIVQTEDEGERTRHLFYLLPNGSRRRVTIDTALDSAEARDQIGMALSEGRLHKGR